MNIRTYLFFGSTDPSNGARGREHGAEGVNKMVDLIAPRQSKMLRGQAPQAGLGASVKDTGVKKKRVVTVSVNGASQEFDVRASLCAGCSAYICKRLIRDP